MYIVWVHHMHATCMVVHMADNYRAMVAHVNDSNRPFWDDFRRVADGLGLSYSRALELAAERWGEIVTDPWYGSGPVPPAPSRSRIVHVPSGAGPDPFQEASTPGTAEAEPVVTADPIVVEIPVSPTRRNPFA